MDYSYSEQETAFRAEVREWCNTAIKGEWGTESWPTPSTPEDYLTEVRSWATQLYDGGWAGITWPTEYGGRDATPIEQFIFQEELSNFRTPHPPTVIGVGMAGPTIMTWGTPEQKDRYLKKILSGEEIWCQGFSEPNAGSDVAAAGTTAVPDGDDYIITGQKIWTSVAHIADFCILLTRTDPNAQKHKGLTYLIVDMKSPGVEVKPLRQITGDAEFNEVFFTDVRVPKANILGKENQGWMVAITTLMHERTNIAALLYGAIRRTLLDVTELAKKIERNGRPLSEDPIVRRKLAHFYANVETQRLNNLRMRAAMKADQDPGPIGSIFKLIWSTANQDLLEMPVDILGPYAGHYADSPGRHALDGLWFKQMLRSRANTIEGGTSEILRNIVGERVLGLPR